MGVMSEGLRKYNTERSLKMLNKNIKKVIQQNEVVKISDLINPNFYPVWKSNKTFNILKGGRSSFKSSVVSLKLLVKFLNDDNSNIVILRKVANYLSTSVYEQIKWAIYTLKCENEFIFLKSPLKIVHRRTGTAFYFFGCDDPIKIKSAKIAKGYITDLWFEEASEFKNKEEIDIVVDTFIRQQLPEGINFQVWFTYNPPRNPYTWINEWVEELEKNRDDDTLIHHSTYLQDEKGFLSKSFIKKIEKVKQNDPEYYEYMYLGKVIGLGNTIYNYSLFNIVEEVPDDDRIILSDIAIDTGYSISATTFLFIGLTLKQRVILLDTYYYSPENKVNKKAPSDFSKDLWKFYQNNTKRWKTFVDTWIIDSADGALRNQFFKDYGIWLTPAIKKNKEDMIDNVRDLMAQGRVYVLNTENNKIFLEEHKRYQRDEKSLEPGKEPKVLKVDDHTVDAFQYYTNNNLQKLGLKF